MRIFIDWTPFEQVRFCTKHSFIDIFSFLITIINFFISLVQSNMIVDIEDNEDANSIHDIDVIYDYNDIVDDDDHI